MEEERGEEEGEGHQGVDGEMETGDENSEEEVYAGDDYHNMSTDEEEEMGMRQVTTAARIKRGRTREAAGGQGHLRWPRSRRRQGHPCSHGC